MKVKLVEKYDSFSKGNTAFLVFQSEGKINFKPGQFMILDNGKLKKPYSIATSPILMDKERKIGFYVKKVNENGMSSYLINDISIGDSIDIQGPFGHMVLKEAENYILISIGSGLAPILSILNHLYLTNFSGNIINIFGERYVENLVPKVIQDINLWASNINLENYILLSRENEDKINEINSKYDKILFLKGHVQDKIDVLNQVNKDNTLVYLCGKPSMVDEVVDMLINNGFDKANIYFEKY